MSSYRDKKDETPLDKKTAEVEAKRAAIHAKLGQTREFLKKAPDLKAEATKREQEEILTSYKRPAQVEGPADVRFDFVARRETFKARTMRKDRARVPWLTVLLVIACSVVVYYAGRQLFRW